MTITTSIFFLGWISSTLGLSLVQTVVAATVGNIVVAIIMYLNGYAGVRYGIPFPIQLRYTFGHKGSVVPLVIRMIVSFFWYGIDGYIAAWAITEMGLLICRVPPEVIVSTALSYTPFVFISYLALVCIIGSVRRIKGIKYLDTIAGPLLLIFFTGYTLYLLCWSPFVGKALPIYNGIGWASSNFFLAIAVQTAWWGTIALNISDICRFNKDPAHPSKTLLFPHLFGLVIPQIFGTILGWITVSMAGTLYSPIDIIVYYAPIPAIGLMGLVFAALATASTNLTGDVPAVANGLVRFARISWKKGVLIATIIAFFVGPWWAVTKSLDMANYLTNFTYYYSMWLGPIAGVMVADYWVYKKRKIQIDQLYNPRGIYYYSKGVLLPSLCSMFIGILGEYLIGLATDSLQWYFGIIPFPGIELAWYYGFGIAFIMYLIWSYAIANKSSGS
jgi:NCS1 family nucleobase:cation symporter-1